LVDSWIGSDELMHTHRWWWQGTIIPTAIIVVGITIVTLFIGIEFDAIEI